MAFAQPSSRLLARAARLSRPACRLQQQQWQPRRFASSPSSSSFVQQPQRAQSSSTVELPIRGHHGEWPSRASPRVLEDFSSPDHHFEHNQIVPEGTAGPDLTNRTFNYAFLGTTKFLMTSIPRVAVYKFAASWSASADVVALSTVEVDLSDVAPGDTVTVSWRGKPVFIRNRRAAEIDKENQADLGSLRDPAADADRHQKPQWVIVLGVCTHLGCVPISNAGKWGGWFCPCHGSHYDTSGRIRKGPAPLNLEVPVYKFLTDTKVLLG